MRTSMLSATVGLVAGIAGGTLATWTLTRTPAGQPFLPASMPAEAPTDIPVSAAPRGQEPIADLVDRVGPAVVNIDTVSQRSVPVQPMMPFGFEDFFGMPFTQRRQIIQQKGVGSGFVIDPSGVVVTNNHVIAGANDLTVTFPDGKKFKGKVVGADPGSDLAVVKIDGQNLPALKLADAGSLRVGQWTVAIGSPLGLTHSVTAGILSAMDREVALNNRVGFLQTSTPINPGNSGGPLLNMAGQVIGVNTAVAAHAQGIGFAVPVATVARVVPQLREHGKVERPWLGVGLKDLPDDRSQMFFPVESGVLVAQVDGEGPARVAGLREGDVILSLDGKPVKSAHDLIMAIGDRKVGATIQVEVSRSGQRKAISIKLGQMPQRLMASAGQEPTEGMPQDQGE